MAIPEHVRKQAMDAVAHKETTAMIRLYRSNDGPGPDFSGPPELKTDYGKITDDIRKQAMDAVSHPETRARIQLVKDTGEVTPPNTPTRNSLVLAERIAEMHKSGQDMNSIHHDVSKDNFGREHG
jgi:hypothetical protein